ncbi:hypothetical protein [Nocardia sp. NBC_01009]|uniref:hypothetical protein n=1 Tax=Nocardia sp. NBC_01009 TaxID=2975996 RepID=UPI003866FA5E
MIAAAEHDHRTIPTPAKTQERMLRISRSQNLDHLLVINEFFLPPRAPRQKHR